MEKTFSFLCIAVCTFGWGVGCTSPPTHEYSDCAIEVSTNIPSDLADVASGRQAEPEQAILKEWLDRPATEREPVDDVGTELPKSRGAWWRRKTPADAPDESSAADIVEVIPLDDGPAQIPPKKRHWWQRTRRVENKPSPSKAEETVAEASLPPSPTIQSGMRINIIVFLAGETEFDEQGKRVETDGTVTLPLVGRVEAAGMTLDQFRKRLTSLYDGNYLVNPQVVVDFAEDAGPHTAPWGYVTVLGAVDSPGKVTIPPTQNLTLGEAIQAAGGLTTVAKLNSIQITYVNGDGKVHKDKVDIYDIDRQGNAGMDRHLNPRDVVFVPETIF